MFSFQRRDVSNTLFLILLSSLVLREVEAQGALAAEIQQIPACANACLGRAATRIGCTAGDFGCLCKQQDAVIGGVGRGGVAGTLGGGCIFRDCGFANGSTARSEFRRVCGLVQAASSLPTSATPPPVAPIPTIPTFPTPTPDPGIQESATESVPAVVSSEVPILTPIPQPTILPSVAAPTIQTTLTPLAPPSSFPTESAAASSSLIQPTIVFPPTDTEAAPSSSIAIIPSSEPSTTPSLPATNPTIPEAPTRSTPPLSPLVIAGITFLTIGFTATIAALAFVTWRRRKAGENDYVTQGRRDEKVAWEERGMSRDATSRDGNRPGSRGDRNAMGSRGDGSRSAGALNSNPPLTSELPTRNISSGSDNRAGSRNGLNSRPGTAKSVAFVDVTQDKPKIGTIAVDIREREGEKAKSRPLIVASGSGTSTSFGVGVATTSAASHDSKDSGFDFKFN